MPSMTFEINKMNLFRRITPDGFRADQGDTGKATMWPEINRYGNSRPVPKAQQRWIVDCPLRAIEMGHRAGSNTGIPKSDTCREAQPARCCILLVLNQLWTSLWKMGCYE